MPPPSWTTCWRSSSAADAARGCSRSRAALEAGGADRRQVPAHRHPDQQLPELEPAADLRAHAVQLGEPQQAPRARPTSSTSSRRASSRVLAAEQTEESPNWFQGTADAVRQSLRHLRSHARRDVLILSGDQLYQMDYRKMLETHRRHVADATVAVIPVTAEQTAAFGILQDEPAGPHRALRGEAAARSPARARLRDPRRRARLPRLDGHLPLQARGPRAIAGATRALVDFGRHVIPDAPRRDARAGARLPRLLGGRRDDPLVLPGQPRAVRRRSRRSTSTTRRAPSTRTRASCRRPRSRTARCKHALISEGCILLGAEIDRAVIGIRSRIGHGARIRNSLLLGADYYETLDEIERASARGIPPIGIGADSVDRERHRRQERAHRPRRAHRQRGRGRARRTATATTSATGS